MLINFLKSKIHRATVTDADLNYEGSISIDPELIQATDLYEFEKVAVYNINTGFRFSTYVITGSKGEITLNGAAARLAQKGDLLIIAAYGLYERDEAKFHKPKIILVDQNNNIASNSE